MNWSYIFAIPVGSHRYSSFIRDVYQSQRDGGQPVREACLATAARPAAHGHPLQLRPAWICARPPHQGTTSSTSAPAMLTTAPSPSDGGGGRLPTPHMALAAHGLTRRHGISPATLLHRPAARGPTHSPTRGGALSLPFPDLRRDSARAVTGRRGWEIARTLHRHPPPAVVRHQGSMEAGHCCGQPMALDCAETGWLAAGLHTCCLPYCRVHGP